MYHLPLTGSNTPRDTVITSETRLPDVLPEEISGTSQSLLGESGGNLLNLSYINQSNTCCVTSRVIPFGYAFCSNFFLFFTAIPSCVTVGKADGQDSLGEIVSLSNRLNYGFTPLRQW